MTGESVARTCGVVRACVVLRNCMGCMIAFEYVSQFFVVCAGFTTCVQRNSEAIPQGKGCTDSSF